MSPETITITKTFPASGVTGNIYCYKVSNIAFVALDGLEVAGSINSWTQVATGFPPTFPYNRSSWFTVVNSGSGNSPGIKVYITNGGSMFIRNQSSTGTAYIDMLLSYPCRV